MPLKSIVIIVLRLYSLSWLVQGICMFASVAAAMAPLPSVHPNYLAYGAAAFMVLAAASLFVFSRLIARIVTPPSDQELTLGGLGMFDLYCFAFTFLGLYFVLSSIANSLNWLHYFFLVARATHDNDPNRETAFYQLSQPLITLLTGAACMLLAPRIARKLIDFHRKQERS